MPDGRFLSKSIAYSEQVGSVSFEADYLFMRMIPHLDSAGRMSGSPKAVRALCCPLRDEMTNEVVERCLTELHAAQLIVWYTVEGTRYVGFPGFANHQRGARLDREAPSRIPAPDDATPPPLRPNSGTTPPKVRVSKEKRREVKQREVDAPDGARAGEKDPDFESCWSAYPKRPNDSKSKARRAWTARVKSGAAPADLLAGTARYAKYCAAKRIAGTEFVKMAATFYGPDEHWTQPWDAPLRAADTSPVVDGWFADWGKYPGERFAS